MPTRCQDLTISLHLPPAKRRKLRLNLQTKQHNIISQSEDNRLPHELRDRLCTIHQPGPVLQFLVEEDIEDPLAELSQAGGKQSSCRGSILPFSCSSSRRRHTRGACLHNQDASIIVNEPLSLQEHGLDAEPRAQQPSDPGKGPPWRHLLAGAASGAVSRTLTAALETLRLQAITGTASHSNLLLSAKSIVRNRGWRALYRGNFLNVVRAAPQKALDFFSFEVYKGLLGAKTSKSMYPTFTAAALAGATSCLTLHPLEVLRSRLTCDNQGRYRGLVSSTQQIVRSEGMAALYRGLGPALLAILPEAAITYGMFDSLKRWYASKAQKEEAGLLPSVACGVMSSFTGQMLAFPLEAISRRLQIEQAAVARLGAVAFVSNVLRHEGPLALYRGIGANVLKTLAMATISFSTYELVCLWLAKLDAQRESEDNANVKLRAV